MGNRAADQCYEAARFAQVVGEMFDDDGISGLSLGLANVPSGKDLMKRLLKTFTDPSDNGFYVVSRKNGTVRRFVMDYERAKATNYKETFLKELTPAEVMMEKAQADAHEYRPQFREFYEKFTAGKLIKKEAA